MSDHPMRLRRPNGTTISRSGSSGKSAKRKPRPALVGAKFAEKLKDVVGLYVDPPAHAVVLSVDEKRSHGEWIATDALAE